MCIYACLTFYAYMFACLVDVYSFTEYFYMLMFMHVFFRVWISIGIYFVSSTIGIFCIVFKLVSKIYLRFMFSKYIFDMYYLYASGLNILLYINLWWVYCIKNSLTSLLYIVHMCRGGNLTSSSIHCILCLCDLELSHPFSSYNACMQRKLT